MAEDVMAGGTYGKEKELQTQIEQGGAIQQEQQESQFLPPALNQIDAFNTVTERQSEPTITGADQMGLIKMSGKEALRAAYDAYPSESILQLYNSLES
tara:strand:+ start:181 stop:474 length:294 start_codon:yes stop_codon:yes gene_type:complete